MTPGQVHRFTVGQNHFDCAVESVPFRLAPEIVHHQEAAIPEVGTQDLSFVNVEDNVARAAHEYPGAMEQLRIGDLEYLRLRIDLERGKLLQAIREVQVGVRKIGPPGIAGHFSSSRAVLEARKSKRLPRKSFVNRPRRHVASIDGSGAVIRATPCSE